MEVKPLPRARPYGVRELDAVRREFTLWIPAFAGMTVAGIIGPFPLDGGRLGWG